MEQCGLDSAIISGMSNESLEALKASAQNNPTLMRELITFLNNASPDPKPITQEEHPVFYDASKNPGKQTAFSNFTLLWLLSENLPVLNA